MRPTAADLLAQSHRYREAAAKAPTVDAERRLASCALALSQMTERIERGKQLDEGQWRVIEILMDGASEGSIRGEGG